MKQVSGGNCLFLIAVAILYGFWTCWVFFVARG